MDKKRISKNEERLDSISLNVSELEKALKSFKENQKNLDLLNKYYGSSKWFEDKEDFESSKTHDIKAGVLSEDAVWNLNENIRDLMIEMKEIVDKYKTNHEL